KTRVPTRLHRTLSRCGKALTGAFPQNFGETSYPTVRRKSRTKKFNFREGDAAHAGWRDRANVCVLRAKHFSRSELFPSLSGDPACPTLILFRRLHARAWRQRMDLTEGGSQMKKAWKLAKNLGFAIAAALPLILATTARAAVSLSLSDNDSTPTSVSVARG